jgi:hypothetical protein
MSMQDMEGYKELMDKLLETLPAEQVLSHYAPEQRLAGLPPSRCSSTTHPSSGWRAWIAITRRSPTHLLADTTAGVSNGRSLDHPIHHRHV